MYIYIYIYIGDSMRASADVSAGVLSDASAGVISIFSSVGQVCYKYMYIYIYIHIVI